MIYYIIDDDYRTYPKYQTIMTSLLSEAKKRRQSMTEILSVADIPGEDTVPFLFILGDAEEWVKAVIHEANLRNIRSIIFFEFSSLSFPDEYSSVSVRSGARVTLPLHYLSSLGRERTALFGVNPASSLDLSAYLTFRDTLNSETSVYWLKNSYKSMFEDFFKDILLYDSVICCNAYAAAFLIQNLKEYDIDFTKDLYVIGIKDSNLSSSMKPSITSLSEGEERFAAAGMSLISSLSRNHGVSEIHVNLDPILRIRDTTGNSPFEPLPAAETIHIKKTNLFFDDASAQRLFSMERLLAQCDDIDRKIIDALINGWPYSYISSHFYISETTAKYRIKKMKALCGISSRSEFIRFLKQFLQ